MHFTQTPNSAPTAADALLHSETVPTPGADPGAPVGTVEACGPDATNEHILVRVPTANRAHAVRGRFVKIVDKARGTRFLGRVIAGPFFPDGPDGDVRVKVEVEGELTGLRTTDTNDRPAAGSPVRALTAERVGGLLGCAGDMRLGTLAGWDAVPVALPSKSKDVLPRNVGIFGTVGSGKSNTAQVLIEEASAAGWAVVVIDVEGEFVEMDEPADRPELEPALAKHGRKPQGVGNFDIIHPASCASDRADSRPRAWSRSRIDRRRSARTAAPYRQITTGGGVFSPVRSW
jgi:DNA helicase HerA-like ATPase